MKRKLATLVDALTLPLVLLYQKLNVITPARGASNAVRPATGYKVLAAINRIREVNNCLLKCLGGCFVCHSENILANGF